MEKTLIDWENDEPVVLGGELTALPETLTNCVLFRTSGSSGTSKWVALSRDSLAWSARTVIDYFSITSRDVLGLALPTHHVGGFGLAARAHFSGAQLKSFEGRWSAKKFTQWAHNVTMTSLVPTQVSDLVKHQLTAPASMRSVIVGGGNLTQNLQKEAQTLGWPVLASYGMTETASQVATGANLPLLPGWEAKLSDGRLALKGEGLLQGYFTDGQLHDPKENGWFLTQDRATLGGRNLQILGRVDRQVKILGELVDVDHLETQWQKALSCELTLLTQEDPRRGKKLILITTGGTSLIPAFNSSLPGPERISSWHVLDTLPRSSLGKINRGKLAQIFHL